MAKFRDFLAKATSRVAQPFASKGRKLQKKSRPEQQLKAQACTTGPRSKRVPSCEPSSSESSTTRTVFSITKDGKESPDATSPTTLSTNTSVDETILVASDAIKKIPAVPPKLQITTILPLNPADIVPVVPRLLNKDPVGHFKGAQFFVNKRESTNGSTTGFTEDKPVSAIEVALPTVVPNSNSHPGGNELKEVLSPDAFKKKGDGLEDGGSLLPGSPSALDTTYSTIEELAYSDKTSERLVEALVSDHEQTSSVVLERPSTSQDMTEETGDGSLAQMTKRSEHDTLHEVASDIYTHEDDILVCVCDEKNITELPELEDGESIPSSDAITYSEDNPLYPSPLETHGHNSTTDTSAQTSRISLPGPYSHTNENNGHYTKQEGIRAVEQEIVLETIDPVAVEDLFYEDITPQVRIPLAHAATPQNGETNESSSNDLLSGDALDTPYPPDLRRGPIIYLYDESGNPYTYYPETAFCMPLNSTLDLNNIGEDYETHGTGFDTTMFKRTLDDEATD